VKYFSGTFVLSTIYAKFANNDNCIAEQMGFFFMVGYTTVLYNLILQLQLVSPVARLLTAVATGRPANM